MYTTVIFDLDETLLDRSATLRRFVQDHTATMSRSLGTFSRKSGKKDSSLWIKEVTRSEMLYIISLLKSLLFNRHNGGAGGFEWTQPDFLPDYPVERLDEIIGILKRNS